MSGYGDKTFWDKRYSSQEGKYDWYLGYPLMSEAMIPLLNVRDGKQVEGDSNDVAKRDRSSLRVLVVGCGNSELSENLYDDGFTNLVSVDYSDVVIKKMQDATKSKSMKFEVMDVRDLKFKNEEFDVVIDKGTLDAILCGTDSAKMGNAMLAECSRVTKTGGYFFLFTYGQPQSRLTYVDKPRFNWRVAYQVLGKSKYMYAMLKRLPSTTGLSTSGT